MADLIILNYIYSHSHMRVFRFDLFDSFLGMEMRLFMQMWCGMWSTTSNCHFRSARKERRETTHVENEHMSGQYLTEQEKYKK